MMQRIQLFSPWLAVLLAMFLAAPANAQFSHAELEGESLGEQVTQRWKMGFVFSAPSGPCRNIVATQTVPMDWPEQKVTIVAKEISPGVDVEYRDIAQSARQMVVTVSRLPAGAEARAVITFDIRRAYLLEPKDTEQFTLPSRTRIPPSLRRYLLPSPYIESSDRTIRDQAAKIVPKDASAWKQVEAIYDWVRDNIEFHDNQGTEPVDTLTTLKVELGDCDEMSCLFIALCRAAGIPARLVQVPGHVYAEFCLLDANGKERWLPCQLAGTRAFGSMPEHRPVLQKGDNLNSPHTGRTKYLILPHRVTAGSGVPRVQIVPPEKIQ